MYERGLRDRIRSKMINAIKRLDKQNIYHEIARLNSQINSCERCDLSKQVGRPVVGEGPANARIFFVGESPSYFSDVYGRPFIGPAGDVLDKWLEFLDLSRDYTYLTNIVKCKKTRAEISWDKIKACEEWLDREIELIKPDLVVTLGTPALRRLYPGLESTLAQAHGKYKIKDDITYFAMWHPSFVAHGGVPKDVEESVKQDLYNLKELLNSMF